MPEQLMTFEDTIFFIFRLDVKNDVNDYAAFKVSFNIV